MIEENISTSNLKEQSEYEGGKIFMKICFLMLGMAGLLPWNAIISDIDFFNNYQKSEKFNPPVVYPFLNFILNIIFQFILVCYKKIFSYKSMGVASLLIYIIGLALLPFCVLPFKSQSVLGIILTSFNILIQGFANAMALSSFFGLVAFFPTDNMVWMSTGQGIAGVLMNIIKYILLIAYKNNQNKEKEYVQTCYIMFGITTFIMILCLIALILAYGNSYFQSVIVNTDEGKLVKVKDDIESINFATKENDGEMETEGKVKEEEIGNAESQGQQFINLIKKTLEMNLFILFLYIVTFTLFPGACLSLNFYGLSVGWDSNTIVICYNIMDTIGRKSVTFMPIKKWLLYILGLGRIVILIFIPLIYYWQVHGGELKVTSTLFLICLIVFALTNGAVVSLCFALAPMQVEDELKGKAGSAVSFFSVLGIFFGTCTAFGMNGIINAISRS